MAVCLAFVSGAVSTYLWMNPESAQPAPEEPEMPPYTLTLFDEGGSVFAVYSLDKRPYITHYFIEGQGLTEIKVNKNKMAVFIGLYSYRIDVRDSP